MTKWLVALATCALIGGCLMGCGDMVKFETAMAFLKDGNADGHLVLTTGGSPLQAGMKQVFFLGPENCALSFDGDVDFGSVAAKDLLPE